MPLIWVRTRRQLRKPSDTYKSQPAAATAEAALHIWMRPAYLLPSIG